MRFIFLLLILAGLLYGGKYLYDNYLQEGVTNTIENTRNFATDKQVKDFNVSGTGEIIQ